MAKTALFYDEATGVIEGTVNTSIDSDMGLNPQPNKTMVLVGHTHRAIGKLHEYRVNGGKIQRRPQGDIDTEKKAADDLQADRETPDYAKSEEEMMKEVFVDYIDKLHKKVGLGGVNITDFNTALNSRRELHRYPKKKVT